MGIETAPAMTSEEIVRLNRQHTFFSWSVQGALDPDRDRPGRGRLPLHARRAAHPRLQQPADVGEHRPRRPAGHRRDHRAGAEAPVRAAGVRDRDPRPPGPEARRDPAGRHGQGVLHAGRCRGDRERHQVRPPLHRPHEGPRALPLVPRRDDGGDDADRRSAPLGERARARRRRPLSRHAPLGRAGAAAGRGEPPGAGGRHPLRGRRTRSRRSSSRPSWGRTASSSRPTATSRASARSATATGSSWSPTRSWPASAGPAAGSRSTTGTRCPT